MQEVKQKLYQHCSDYVTLRIQNAQEAVEAAQNSANSETKSTAGDKHDTARAMMQLAAEQNAKHLNEANKLTKVMQIIDPKKVSEKGELGSLIVASNGTFYISISVGKIELGGDVYFAISPTSPMGQLLTGLTAGDKAQFNGRKIEVLEVY